MVEPRWLHPQSLRTIFHGGAAVAASAVVEADEVGTEDVGAPGVRRRKACETAPSGNCAAAVAHGDHKPS